MDDIAQTWRRLAPGWPFDYVFLDDDYDRQYRAEEQMAKLFHAFTALAVLIACLGLFGLAAFSAEQRTKEIGIRKVLGASTSSILLLFSKEFTKLIALAFVLAAPVAYVAMNRWLEDFAYHVEIDVGLFLLVGGAVLSIAWLTISYQAIKAALADPVKSLHHE